jgi:hypothetical protein
VVDWCELVLYRKVVAVVFAVRDPRTAAGLPAVPYVAAWSAETGEDGLVREFADRVVYLGEGVGDRDRHGILWGRTGTAPGRGRPQLARVHAFRQRRAMRFLLCQVCARPCDRSDEGTLWLFPSSVVENEGWPDGPVSVTEPPICRPCARHSVAACPALRRGHLLVRAGRTAEIGVHGLVYRSNHPSPVPVAQHADLVVYGTPAARWVVASKLVREIADYSVVDVAGL